MSDNSGNKTRNDINRIRELIRNGSLTSGIPQQEGMHVEQASVPPNFPKGNSQEPQIS
jgi:hypothetical protein